MSGSTTAPSERREIDVRVLDHGSGTSANLSSDGRGRYVVEIVTGTDTWMVYRGKDTAEALDAYQHPFARASVPNIWARVPAPSYDLADDEHGVKV